MKKFEIESGSSTAHEPYLIYTADGSDPKEIDDGIFVERLDAEGELYQVGVCVADVSKLYHSEVRHQAMTNVHAVYWDLPDGERGYDPMIDPEIIADLEFKEGRVKNALIVQFVIGATVAPTDIDVVFGKIETVKNYTYKELSGLQGAAHPLGMYGRVGSLIQQQIGYKQGGDSAGRNRGSEALPLSESYKSWKHGARVNEAFMVAANHLAGVIMRDENRPAIYRVYNPADDSNSQFVDANWALYQKDPGLHVGLQVDPYCRVTSGLRRLEDLIMSYHFRLRHEGKKPTRGDINIINDGIRALNKRAIFESVAANPGVRARNERISAQNAAAQERVRLRVVGG